MIRETEFIFYVSDQAASKNFYEKLLKMEPSLDVPGMTQFNLTAGLKLGLMPEDGIARIITGPMPHPNEGNGIPRCELYLKVKNAGHYLERGLQLGGIEISPLEKRNWGDEVGYIADPDGHVIAFAEA